MSRSSLLVTLLLLVAVDCSIAQQNVASPYSRYAIGDINQASLAAYSGMGSANIALADSGLINFNNPASYGFIMQHRPIFDIGVAGQSIRAQSSNDSEYYRAVGLRNIVLAFPVSKRTGLSFGVMPFSSVGYDMSATVSEANIGDVTYNYNGSGGFNRLYLGLGTTVINSPKHKFSLGLNSSYLFGNIERSNTAIYPAISGVLHSKVKYNTVAHDFTFDFGLLYRGKSGENNWFSFGATAGMPSKLDARQELFAFTFRSTTTEQLVDTVRYVDSIQGKIRLPLRLGYGFAYEINQKISNNGFRKYIFSAQLEMQDWSTYSETFDTITVKDQLRDSRAFSFGFQFTPYNSNNIDLTKVRYWQLINYRLGARYANTALQLNNTQLQQYGISFGLGLPLLNSQSLSSLNLGFEYGKRGTTENNLLLENYFNFYIGFSISPHRNDGWFYKRKYD